MHLLPQCDVYFSIAPLVSPVCLHLKHDAHMYCCHCCPFEAELANSVEVADALRAMSLVEGIEIRNTTNE
jgi:hypothetical protein